ncbi:MAG TPA: SIS domain-containing protein [Ktedonobacteraceae bacterium]|nr:SIS domain-containing protein [Ktedonobacteraceae bacterium]
MSDQQPTGLYRSIHAQPAAVRALLADWDGPTRAAEQLARARRIIVAGIGTSFHAATVGEYLLRLAGADAWAVRSFEFVHYPRPLRDDDAVIVVSHRGSKLHGNLAVERALASGVTTIGITGRNSKMQGASPILETVEQDPSSTHSISYTGALTRLAQIAARLAALNGLTDQARALEHGLASIPGLMEGILSREDEVRQAASEAAAHNRRFYYIGAGPNAVTATEGALKAKEAAYVTAEGFELEQGIHGPQVAFEGEDLLIPISVQGSAQARMADFLLALGEIGSHVWLIGSAPSEETAALFDGARWKRFSLGNDADLSAVPEELTPMLAALPVQLLAEFLATARGTNADSFRADQEAYKRAGARFRI